MYNLQKNNYHLKPKPFNIQTPLSVSQFIFELLKDEVSKKGLIFDPCCGIGNLLEPWKKAGYPSYGIDINPKVPADQHWDFLGDESQGFKLIQIWGCEKELLILCNPPFNGYGHKLGSEVWLDKIIELFGQEVPIALFAPMGFRLNGKKNGKRWSKFTNQVYPPITSIISLPRDIFPTTEFHSEILIFNIPNLQPHYFFNPHEIQI